MKDLTERCLVKMEKELRKHPTREEILLELISIVREQQEAIKNLDRDVDRALRGPYAD